MTLEELETSDVGRRIGYLRGGAIAALLLVLLVEVLLVVFLILFFT